MTDAELEDLSDMIISGNARWWRLCSGVSISATADALGCGVTSLRQWENGLVPVQRATRELYYRFLCGLRDKLG